MPDPVVWGMVGGVLGEFANIYDHRKEDRENWPSHLRRKSYWVISAATALAGGLIVAAHEDSGVDMNAILAMNVGVTTPLLIKTGFRGALDVRPGTTDQDEAGGSGAASNGSGT